MEPYEREMLVQNNIMNHYTFNNIVIISNRLILSKKIIKVRNLTTCMV